MGAGDLSHLVQHQATLWVQTEEDARIVTNALKQGPRLESVLCIASGGCTPLALLSESVPHVIAVDLNPSQLAITRLKLEGIRRLSFNEWKASWLNEDARAREHCGELISEINDLPGEFVDWITPWLQGRTEKPLLDLGQMQGVGTELKRYDPSLSKILQALLSGANSEKGCDELGVFSLLAELRQRRAETFFGAGALPETDEAVAKKMRADFCRRFASGVRRSGFCQNPYLSHLLLGTYIPQATLFYFEEATFRRIKKAPGTAELVQADIIELLKGLPAYSLTGADVSNLSDLLCEKKREELFLLLGRALKPNARVVHRGLIRDTAPPAYEGYERDVKASSLATRCDRTYLYEWLAVDVWSPR